MTFAQLCETLALPAGTPAAEVSAVLGQRLSELEAELRQEGQSRIVRIMLQQKREALAQAVALRPQLELWTRIERLLAELRTEEVKSDALRSRSVIVLCFDRLAGLLSGVTDEGVRFGYEKQGALLRETLVRPPPPVSSAPSPVPLPTPPVVVAMPVAPPAPPPSPQPAPGTVLRLFPTQLEGTRGLLLRPVNLVARPRFILGRRRASADFVTWFLPENEHNQARTDMLSRTHVTFSLQNRQIWLQDGEILGDGSTKPSGLGTYIDQQAIRAPVVINFLREKRLALGINNYELAVLQLPGTRPDGPLAAPRPGLPTAKVPVPPDGCLRFRALASRDVYHQAVWVFTEAAMGAGPQCAIPIEAEGVPPVAVRFHFWRGGYWIEYPSGIEFGVVLDDRPLTAGEILPLQAAHKLQLGGQPYALTVGE